MRISILHFHNINSKIFEQSEFFKSGASFHLHASIISLSVQFADLQADQEETQRSLQQAKKKCQRLMAELQDTKLHLENQQSRNHELEKKQRKWVHALFSFSF